MTGLGAIIGKAFLYIACVLSGECLDILTELKDVIDRFGSAAPEDYLWGAEQLLDAVGLWPLLPKIQAAMPWMMSFALSAIPGWGDLYDLTSAVLGYDPITGESLSWWMRGVALVAAIIPIISAVQLRQVDNVVDDAVIQIYGFRGAGKEFRDEFVSSEPLLYYGHVGISFDNGRTIIGQTPYAPGQPLEEVVSALLNHKVYPSRVGDDTYIFNLAQDYAEQKGLRTQVYVWSQSYPREIYEKIRQSVADDLAASPLSSKLYGFPQTEHVCYNCATWPATVGVQIPEPSGLLSVYVPLLEKLGKPWQR